MYISKMALPRRTFLRGVGSAMALPLLDAMIPALSASTGAPVMRLAFFYCANGITMAHWHPKGSGTDFELSPNLMPLAPFRSQLVVVTGLANREAEDPGSGPHTRCH